MSIIQCRGLMALFPSNEISGMVLRKSLHNLSSACEAKRPAKQTRSGMRFVQRVIALARYPYLMNRVVRKRVKITQTDHPKYRLRLSLIITLVFVSLSIPNARRALNFQPTNTVVCCAVVPLIFPRSARTLYAPHQRISLCPAALTFFICALASSSSDSGVTCGSEQCVEYSRRSQFVAVGLIEYCSRHRQARA